MKGGVVQETVQMYVLFESKPLPVIVTDPPAGTLVEESEQVAAAIGDGMKREKRKRARKMKSIGNFLWADLISLI